MSDKKNNRILESFNSCNSLSKINEILNLQKNDPVISADQLYDKVVFICGLGDIKLSFYDISSNVKKFSAIIDNYPGYGYECVVDRLNDKRKSFLNQLIENIGSLNEALILFNEISDFDTCILPDEGSFLISFDKKIGSFCLDKNNIRGILSELSGFLKKTWKESSRVEISKFYYRIYEKFCVVFFIGIKTCEDFNTAVKYLECIYFNLPSDFKVTEGMNKIISSEELINKFADLCKNNAADDNEICARVDKISNLILSIEKLNTKTEYFCDQLKKRAIVIPENNDSDSDTDPGFEQLGILDDTAPVEKTYNDVLLYPETDNDLASFLAFCKSGSNNTRDSSELFYLANAVRILLGIDYDNLPDPVSSDDDAVLWGRSFYKSVYDSHFNDSDQFYVVSSFAEGIPAICKKISEFIKRYFEEKKDTVSEKDFASICIAYPNSISSPYYIDAEKALGLVVSKNSGVLVDFINFCLEYDFTQYPIIVHIVNENADKQGWGDAATEFGEEPEEFEENDRSGLNRGIWFIVLIIILLLAAASYYFFFYLRTKDEQGTSKPSVTTSQTSVITTTEPDLSVPSSDTTQVITSSAGVTISETSFYGTTEMTASPSTTAAQTEVHTTEKQIATKTTSKPTSTKATSTPTKTTAATKTTSVVTKPTEKTTSATAAVSTMTTAENTTSEGTTSATTVPTVQSTTASEKAETTSSAVSSSETHPSVKDTTKAISSTTNSDNPSVSVSD